MTTELVVQHPSPLEFTNEQRQMIRSMFAKDATDAEFQVLMEIARIKRLNPITGQCHFVARPENLAGPGEPPRWGKKWSVQTGIDGFRSKAEEHPAYDGQSQVSFEYSADGKELIAATVSVFRKDRAHPFTTRLLLKEYAQRKKDGSLTKMWAEKTETMLGKCALAASLRAAFPWELGGLYTEDEMPAPGEEAPSPAASKARPAGSAQVVEGEVIDPTLTEEAMQKTIADADTMAKLLEVVPKLAKFPEGPQKVGLRKAYGDRKTALQPPEPGSNG